MARTPDKPWREVVTIDGKNLTIEHDSPPVENAGIVEGKERFQFLDIMDPRFVPENYNKADGAPLRMFDAEGVKIDLSKRSKEDMGFWHRNVDHHEIIFCFRGALLWETELGSVTLKPGQMILIPKGITHRSMLCDESDEENILLELKIRDELTFVGDK